MAGFETARKCRVFPHLPRPPALMHPVSVGVSLTCPPRPSARRSSTTFSPSCFSSPSRACCPPGCASPSRPCWTGGVGWGGGGQSDGKRGQLTLHLLAKQGTPLLNAATCTSNSNHMYCNSQQFELLVLHMSTTSTANVNMYCKCQVHVPQMATTCTTNINCLYCKCQLPVLQIKLQKAFQEIYPLPSSTLSPTC